MGHGPRSDFRRINGPNADFNHNYDNMLSLKQSLKDLKRRGTKKETTFGSSWQAYNKVVVPGAAHFSKVLEHD